MKVRTFIVRADGDFNLRIDQFLASTITDFSRSKIKAAILNGGLTHNGNLFADPSASTKSGVYSLVLNSNIDIGHIGKNIPIEIVYEDQDLLVLNKQAGLTVHPGAGNHDDTLVNALLYHFGTNLSAINGIDKPGIVHRLDRDTSGLMVVAKNDFTHMKLAEQLQDRTLTRQYYALCYGVPLKSHCRVETYIDRSRSDRTKMKVTKNTGRIAVTDYEVVESFGDGALSFIKCKLHTGRTHQIRVHMTHLGHPIIGDQSYGAQPSSLRSVLQTKVIDEINKLKRQALQSFYMEFIHPSRNEKLSFTINLDEDLERIIKLCNI
jgi:23S rRNA pseudouridine1911/1915/1917 synthase